jgi:type VI secretion system protein ImpL
MAVVTLALAAAWTASYFGNRALVAEAQARAAAAARELEALRELRPGDEPRLLTALTALRGLAPEPAGAWLRLGLHQGDKIAAQAERAYRNTLRETLLAHLAFSLENALRSAPSREVLDAYVALHGSAEARLLEQGAQRVWRLPESARADLASHLRVALTERPLALPRPRDDALIEQARRKLGTGTPA